MNIFLRSTIRRIRTWYYTKKVRLNAGDCRGIVRANKKTVVTRNTYLGNNVNFNGLSIQGNGKVEIGENFHSGEDCLFITQVHNFRSGSKLPYDSSYILKNIIIEDQVWIGSRVVILGGVKIGEGSVIQAGSVVVNDIPRLSIAGGNPCKVFDQRDTEHYDRLKAERKFH